MSNCLQVENLTKSFGADVIVDRISFTIDEGEKIGLIAKNGTGKSTLLNIIAGVDTPDSGTITTRNNLRIGYLPQAPTFPPQMTVMDACLDGDTPAARAVREYEQALAENDSNRITTAIQEIDNLHAWDYEDRFKQILHRLKITDFKQPVAQLSGGQVKRIALARILISEPQLLILDEPTNHLDIDMIEWLEGYLQRASMTLLMVTHDRYFLDNICSRIIEIDDHTTYSYDGNYNYYLQRRAERIEARDAQIERARNLLRTELDWMRRQPQARAHKARYRIDAFHDLKQRAQRVHDAGDVQLQAGNTYIGKKIFTAHDVSLRFGDKVILDRLNYTFARYEKLGIVGDNGVGKTSFIRLLLQEIAPDSGHFEYGETLRFGYYSQQGIQFDPDKRVIDAVRDIAEEVVFDEKNRYSAMQLLSKFLFTPRDQQKLIAKLSGGEQRRLYLATVLMRAPNFLILDEPTNDLDIQTLGVLEDFLANFKGCVIVVSHDRFFMDRTVDHTWVFLGNGEIRDFPGNYSQYRAWREAHPETAETPASPTPQQRKPRTDRPARLTYKQKQEYEALTDEIRQLTDEIARLDALFASGQPLDDIDRQAERYQQLRRELDAKETRWLELSELAEA